MKKGIIITVCILLVSSSSFAVDLQDDGSTQHQSQARATIQSQERIDPDSTPAVLQAMQRYQFRHENTLHVRNMIQDAQQKGLPASPITDKVYEGIAKNIDEDRIIQAVERVSERYENAYRQANTLSTDKEQARQLGQTIAEAYTAGLKEEDCARIITQLQTRTRTINQQESKELTMQTMATARIMARRNVQSTTISDVLENALQHSYQAHEVHTLQTAFVKKARYGSPEDVAREFYGDISHDVTASDLGSRSTASGPSQAGVGPGSSGGSSGSGDSGDSGSSGSSGSGDSGDSGSSGSSGSGDSGDSGSSGSSGSGDSGDSGSGGSGDSGSSGSSGSGGSGDSGSSGPF